MQFSSVDNSSIISRIHGKKNILTNCYVYVLCVSKYFFVLIEKKKKQHLTHRELDRYSQM